MGCWAAALGLESGEFSRGRAAGVESCSQMQVGALLMPTCAGFLDALYEEQGSGSAFEEGRRMGVLLGVLGAEDSAPLLRFLELIAEADGNCLFHALAGAVGRSGEALRTEVLGGLAADWGAPCRVPGYKGLTVGQALAADHKVEFADEAAYLGYKQRAGADGVVPYSMPVEQHRATKALGRPVCVWSRMAEGDGVVLESVAHGTGAVVHLLHGMHGQGGSHYNCLLAEDARDGDGEPEGGGDGGGAGPSTVSLRVSRSKWADQVFASVRACMGTLTHANTQMHTCTMYGGCYWCCYK